MWSPCCLNTLIWEAFLSVSLSLDSISQLTARDIAAAVAQDEVTPTEVAEAYLARIERLETRVQAWSYLDRASVRAQAAVLTEEARAGKLRGALHGVPVGVKDEFHLAGVATRMAGPQPQTVDATAVVRLREAGAIIMGKTHMPVDGVNPPTRNPWNLEHTAGGTSSGSGAAVGARMVPFALGEQTAGSNLRPAAFCGVDAFKPTWGRISRFGCYPFSYSYDHVGLIGLTMADIALAFSVLAGPDPLDPTSLPDPAPPGDLDLGNMPPPRIGVIRNFFPEHTDREMLEAIEKAATRFKGAGAQVVGVSLPDDFNLTWLVHRLTLGVEGLAVNSKRYLAPNGPEMSIRHQVASLVPAAYYLQAQRIRRHLWQEVQQLFSNVDAFLLSVAPGAAPRGVGSTGDTTMLVPWSCLGYPTLTISGGLSPADLPLGLQLVGAPMADHQLLRIGAWGENVLGRLPPPPID